MASWWENLFGDNSMSDVVDQYSQYGAGQQGPGPSTSSGFGGVGTDPSAGGLGGGLDWGTIGEAVSSAFGGSSTGFGGTGMDPATDSPNFTAEERMKVADGEKEKEGEGIIGKLTGFVNKNPRITEMLLKGVAGAMTADQAQNDRKALLREQQAIQNDDNARYSASVSGLRGPGIIAKQAALKRINGDQVFTSNGRINRG